MPGAPNYESVKNGDFPSERWFFEPNEQSKKYLRESGVFETIPDDFRPVVENWNDHLRIVASCMDVDLESLFKLLQAILTDPMIAAADFDKWKRKAIKKAERVEREPVTVLRQANLDLLFLNLVFLGRQVL